jgi:hypothetical protein
MQHPFQAGGKTGFDETANAMQDKKIDDYEKKRPRECDSRGCGTVRKR